MKTEATQMPDRIQIDHTYTPKSPNTALEFFGRVNSFNRKFGLPTPAHPHGYDAMELQARLERFRQIMLDEVYEVDEIIMAIQGGTAVGHTRLEILAMLGDWLGDIVVYAVSEARRHGLPLPQILDVIMDSNDSKLGPDGKAIIKDGKVQKGPGYWKPEPKIMALIHRIPTGE